MDTAFVSRNCPKWCYCRGGRHFVEPKVQPPTSPSSCVPACRMLHGVGTWLINGVATVFFTSLERCSCIAIDTIDDFDDFDDSIHLPLIIHEGYGNEAEGKKGTELFEKNEDGYIDKKMHDSIQLFKI
ncbi:unnamed protein product [Dovyalis caffra]|uniref:Uncharacterized protein n=1 Tax=Dovyalis caffra TaxID=77055 RepID=A0AAV1RW15_9ROSI|nr:unnamed protein product [Dovyalis caffra]